MKQSGSALVYILIAIALLAALTASFMQPASQQTTSQNIVKTVSDLKSQAEFLRSSIQECILVYAGGDVSTAGTVLPNTPYPINPSSTYFDTAGFDPGNISTDEAKYIRCPGNPGTTKNHARIFGATTGKSMPPPPDLFEDWKYYSGPNGVFFYTRSTKTDAFIKTALDRLDDQFSECEADIVTAAGTDVSMTTTATSAACPAGNVCFRVWMIARTGATNAYQAGTPERTASCPN